MSCRSEQQGEEKKASYSQCLCPGSATEPGSRLGNLGCSPKGFSFSPRATAETAGKPSAGKAEDMKLWVVQVAFLLVNLLGALGEDEGSCHCKEEPSKSTRDCIRSVAPWNIYTVCTSILAGKPRSLWLPARWHCCPWILGISDPYILQYRETGLGLGHLGAWGDPGGVMFMLEGVCV